MIALLEKTATSTPKKLETLPQKKLVASWIVVDGKLVSQWRSHS